MEVLYSSGGGEQWSLDAKLRIQSFPSVCSQVGWQGASAGWWLSGGTDSLSQGDHCHMPVCPQCWRLTRPTRPGPLVMPSLSAVGRLWQLTRHLGLGRQGPEHCYLYRHQDLLLPRKREERSVVEEDERETHILDTQIKDHILKLLKSAIINNRDLSPISESLS